MIHGHKLFVTNMCFSWALLFVSHNTSHNGILGLSYGIHVFAANDIHKDYRLYSSKYHTLGVGVHLEI